MTNSQIKHKVKSILGFISKADSRTNELFELTIDDNYSGVTNELSKLINLYSKYVNCLYSIQSKLKLLETATQQSKSIRQSEYNSENSKRIEINEEISAYEKLLQPICLLKDKHINQSYCEFCNFNKQLRNCKIYAKIVTNNKI